MKSLKAIVLPTILLSIASLIVSTNVSAEIFSYRLTGQVWDTRQAPSGSDVESLFSVGDTYIMEFSYDNSNETPRDPNATLAQFFPPLEVRITYSNGYQAEAFSGRILVANSGGSGSDWFSLEMLYNDPQTSGPVLSGPDVGNSHLVLLQLLLNDISGTAFDSVDLGPLPPLSAFQGLVEIIFHNELQEGSRFKATVDTLEIAALTFTYSCSGFDSPMASYPVKAKKNRVFPLKMELFDDGGFVQTDAEITAPPVVQVMFTPLGGEPIDVSDDALSAGAGSDGNQFDFTDDGIWQFNLKSKNYTAEGTYLVTAVSGDESEYTIDPSCVTSFVIE